MALRTKTESKLRVRRAGIRQWEGPLNGRGLRIGIVVSRFNNRLTRALAEAAIEELTAAGVAPGDIEVAWVPGAFEIPLVLSRWAGSDRFDALLALGVIITGDTPHAGLISTEVTRGVAELSRRHGLPVLDGVVAVHTLEQAQVRCEGSEHNRGRHAARAAVEMARLLARLEGDV